MMTSHTVLIHANEQPELVERVLRTVRHRGFRLLQCQVQIKTTSAQNDSLFEMTLTVESERNIQHLIHQLNKLWDVSEVQLQSLA